MIKFFSKIRHKLLAEGSAKRYLLYAVGEILLVVIGILIALQINNLNQQRIDRASENHLYQDVLASLQKDSIAIVKIINLLEEATESQVYFINTSFSQIVKDYDRATIQEKVLHTRNGILSFFPQEGVFGSIVANNDITLIRSAEIKTKLLELYDYKYRRNENADIVMENYYQHDVSKFFSSKLKLVATYDDSSVILRELDLGLLKDNYDEFGELLGYIYPHTFVVKNFLADVQASINELIYLLKVEIVSE